MTCTMYKYIGQTMCAYIYMWDTGREVEREGGRGEEGERGREGGREGGREKGREGGREREGEREGERGKMEGEIGEGE